MATERPVIGYQRPPVNASCFFFSPVASPLLALKLHEISSELPTLSSPVSRCPGEQDPTK